MKTIRVGGFFTGIGAHVSACDRLESNDVHFEHVFQCEFDKKTEMGFNVLHSNHGVIRNLGDIRGVHDIGGDLQVDLLFPSPPCQDISTAGLQKGNSKDSGTRSALAFEVPRIIRNTPPSERPRYMVMEEVPMMMSKKFMPNLLEYLGELSELGYQHNYAILNSADYGVAQSRRRFYCISKLGGKAPAMPEPFPLTKCLRDYLDPEPVADHYYLSKERIEGLIWSTDKQSDKGNNFAFKPTDGGGTAVTLTSKAGTRKTDNFVRIPSSRRDHEFGNLRTKAESTGRWEHSLHCRHIRRRMRSTLSHHQLQQIGTDGRIRRRLCLPDLRRQQAYACPERESRYFDNETGRTRSSGQMSLRIRDGRTFTEAQEGDGIKLIFPKGTESCGRVGGGFLRP